MLVRSGYGVERSDEPAVVAERPAGRYATVEDPRADALTREEDDPFQWFVDLFVAEYASEASSSPDDPSIHDLSVTVASTLLSR